MLILMLINFTVYSSIFAFVTACLQMKSGLKLFYYCANIRDRILDVLYGLIKG